MAKCQRCIAEEEAGMACLTCPCSSSESTTRAKTESGSNSNTKEALNMEDLIVLDITQLQNLCVNGNLEATGNRATLMDRLLRSFGPRREKAAATEHMTRRNYELKDLLVLSNAQLQELSAKENMQAVGLNRATLVYRLNHRFGSRRQKIAAEMNNNEQVDLSDINLNAKLTDERMKVTFSRVVGGKVVKGNGIMGINGTPQRNLDNFKRNLNGAEVSKRVEDRLASMEARLKSGEGGDELRKKVELVRSKLQRYYFLAQLLPLSKNSSDYDAFIKKYKEQELDETLAKIQEDGRQLGVVTTTNQGLSIKHTHEKRGRSESSDDHGVRIVEEVHKVEQDCYCVCVANCYCHEIVLQMSDESWRQLTMLRGIQSKGAGCGRTKMTRLVDVIQRETGAIVLPKIGPSSKKTILISGNERSAKKAHYMIQSHSCKYSFQK